MPMSKSKDDLAQTNSQWKNNFDIEAQCQDHTQLNERTGTKIS